MTLPEAGGFAGVWRLTLDDGLQVRCQVLVHAVCSTIPVEPAWSHCSSVKGPASICRECVWPAHSHPWCWVGAGADPFSNPRGQSSAGQLVHCPQTQGRALRAKLL